MGDSVQDIVSQIRGLGGQNKETDISRSYLVALEGDTALAFPVSYLVETIQPEREHGIVRIPLSEEHILGVVNVRGEMLPVLSFNKILGFEGGSSKFLVVVKDGYQIAFAFDALMEIVDIRESLHRPVVNIEERIQDTFLGEEFDFEGKTVRVVNVPALFKSSFVR